MPSELIINTAPWETRIALLENGSVVEFHVERKAERGYVGNIYKGRVVRVLPGMQAAFVEIGLNRTGFIYISDVYDHISEFETLLKKGCCEEENASNEDDSFSPQIAPAFRIEDLLFDGQEILVQVTKEPIGSKGARLTSHISIPGRHLVLMPTIDQVGISHRITDETERKRLRDLIESLRPKGIGFISRTACEGLRAEEIQAEMDFLVQLWANIQYRAQNMPIPSLVYEDLDITLRAIRDLLSGDVHRVVVDSEDAYHRILGFVDTFAPQLKSRIELYKQPMPIFDAYGIEVEMARSLGEKIWLKSGGYIVMETTEALTVIDVNTGKFVGKRNLEDTILKTNLEAAKEIAYQLRLRNIGGLIVIDFIDMESAVNREDVFNTLKEALKKDKCKTNILKMSEMGLIQMTRKRNREGLQSILCDKCFYCEGKGWLKSKRTICYEIFRKIQREAGYSHARRIELLVHPKLGELLLKEESHHVEHLEHAMEMEIAILPQQDFHLEQYDIRYL
ncbi:MAG: Rne/Rng family ribonuclease [Dissulfuribacterales bacterium]